jgi:cytochrome c556
MKILSAAVCAAIIAMTAPAWAAEDRELVKMPAMMQEHMLTSMRDHLDVLNEILADIAAEKFTDAARVAESRLGTSSFGQHNAAHMAQFMPKGMQEAGTALHRAASRFALAAEETDLDRSYKSVARLTGALSEMTAACSACHAGYRIR